MKLFTEHHSQCNNYRCFGCSNTTRN